MKKSLSGVLYLLFFGVVCMLVSSTVYATNGMNMEGYGPIATGMGGASMAYDNGAAAMMNNPATLGLMPEGSRFDLALGYLGAKITAEMGGVDAKSSATGFFMPAIGWVAKTGQFSYGIGMFAQGGMGTEYDADSIMAAGSGEKVRSEVSMGRVLVPFAYEVNKDFSIAITADFVWAEMDLQMALSGTQFLNMAGMDMTTTNQHQAGFASGDMVTAFAGMYQGGYFNTTTPVQWARFDFSDGSAYTGKAKGTGYAGKIGGVYKVSKDLTIGAAYHSKTAMSDLEAEGATVSFNVNFAAGGNSTIPVNGKISVKDFEWPQMAAVGMAYQVSDDLMIAADYKWINWAAVMKSFKMTFTADENQTSTMAQGFAGKVLDAELTQNWKDQNVFMIGVSYKADADWTLRAGLNIANNPIPGEYLNALFPAIIKNHVTLGAGYMISKASSVDFSYAYAPEVKQTSGSGVTSTHSQSNMQLMYSYRF